MQKADVHAMAIGAERLSDYSIKSLTNVIPYPFLVRGRGNPDKLAYVKAYQLVCDDDSSKVHTVVLGYRPDEGVDGFHIWCGDKFLDGDMKAGSAAVRAKEASNGDAALSDEIMLHFGTTASQSSPCNFWSKKKCKHTNHVLAVIDIDGIMDELEASAGGVASPAPASMTPIVDEDDPMLAFFAKYAFKKHVLAEGDKGSGKTFGAHAYCDKAGLTNKLFFAGHEGIEAIDMLGHFVQYGGEHVWKDGKLAMAFRRAAKGEKVVLFIDEILRIPARELNILVGALTPDNKGQYALSTGRITAVVDGIGEEETLVCPAKNLWVVATTNVGVDYDVDGMDAALGDRFRVFRKDTEKDELQRILVGKLTAKRMRTGMAKKLVKFWEKMNELRTQGELSREVNTRHLSEAVEFADKESDIKLNLHDLILNWIDRDTNGKPVTEQADLIKKAIEAHV